MNRQPLWRLSVATTPEAEEAVTELLGLRLEEPVSSYTDVRTGRTTVSIYLSSSRTWTEGGEAWLRAGLREMKAVGVRLGRVKISFTKIRREDWADSWKRHFKPIEIGLALLVRPSWSRRARRRGQAVVTIDPGLSFGTGQHPTTAFCLRQLVARRQPGASQSFLDVGSGSGILAIAAAKLGYRPVDALDFDRDAIRIARANARQNRASHRICFREQDAGRLPPRGGKRYSLVCANLVGDLLLTARKRICARLQPAGILVIAGVLDREFARVRKAYEAEGLLLQSSRREKEWRSGAFRKAKSKK
jgi:ribosomal protein L11 methyltransferase